MDLWTDIDAYLARHVLPAPSDDDPHAIVGRAAAALDAELPAHGVSPLQGRLLELLVRICGARRVLELGTLGGVSAIWIGRALPEGGWLVTVEVAPRAAAVASDAVRAAGLGQVVEVRLEDASVAMRSMLDAGAEPFDFVFLDADKALAAEHLDLALQLSRPGTVIVADTVVRGGAVADAASADPAAQGVRGLFARLETDARLQATAIQTVGAKGHDGLAIALVTG